MCSHVPLFVSQTELRIVAPPLKSRLEIYNMIIYSMRTTRKIFDSPPFLDRAGSLRFVEAQVVERENEIGPRLKFHRLQISRSIGPCSHVAQLDYARLIREVIIQGEKVAPLAFVSRSEASSVSEWLLLAATRANNQSERSLFELPSLFRLQNRVMGSSWRRLLLIVT